jgi:predicted permease
VSAATVGAGPAPGALAGVDDPIRGALVPSGSFPNSGNYGVPLSAFAFGAVRRSTAVVFLAVQSVLVYTVGTSVAARAGGTNGLAGLARVVRVPLTDAVVAALAARAAGVFPSTGQRR